MVMYLEIVFCAFTILSCLALLIGVKVRDGHAVTKIELWAWRAGCCIVTVIVIWFLYYPIIQMVMRG